MRITQDIREYAKKGMDEMSEKFRAGGNALYVAEKAADLILGRAPPRHLQHRRRDVDADDGALRADPFLAGCDWPCWLVVSQTEL